MTTHEEQTQNPQPRIQTKRYTIAKTGIKVIKKTKGRLARVAVPPMRSASVSKRGSRWPERDRTIRRVNKAGRRG